MINSYLNPLKENPRILVFGVILMILSAPGQTFFLSLFTDNFQSYLAISEGDLGALFALATFASAFLLPLAGQKIDQMSLPRYTIVVGGILCLACALISLALPSVIFFTFCIFLLRFGGQGLMIHTATTTILRTFPAHCGKASAIVGLFYSIALTFIPVLTAMAITLSGWRATWLATAAIVITGVLIAYNLLPKTRQPALITTADDFTTTTPKKPPSLGLMLLLCPATLAVSFVFTGLIFHQATLAIEKDWTLTWLASCFSAFAVSQAAASFLIAPLIDKWRSPRFLPLFLLPMGVGLGLIAIFKAPWIAPIYMALIGVSAAIDLKLSAILWIDLYGVENIGYTNSRFEALRIITTGIAPFIVGVLLDNGVALTRQAAGYAVYALCVSFLAFTMRKTIESKSPND